MPGHLRSQRVRRKLLRWYAGNARDLPWRRTRDPYAIWVSEIMLQQTRVDTVIPYYERFLKRFPNVKRLAEADEQAVLELWSGLGYYRRARLLHKGAKQVCSEHRATLPRDPVERREIAGVGAYTSGAIGSIAYGLEEAIVDGNVKRVLSRIFEVDEPVNERLGEAMIWKLAGRLVSGEDPGALNQAMMELGALVCSPKNPACHSCPVRSECAAHKNGRVHELPKKKPKKKAREEDWTVVAPVHLGSRKIALFQHSGERFGGLWTPPMALTEKLNDPKQLLQEVGLSARLRPEVLWLRHQLTHRDMRLAVRVATGARRTDSKVPVRFIALDEKPRLATASLTHKVLAAVRDMLA